MFENLLARIDGLTYENIDNELTFEEFDLLYDVYMTLKFDNYYDG